MRKRLVVEALGLAAVIALWFIIPAVMGGDRPPMYVIVTFAVIWVAIRVSMILPPYYRARSQQQH